MAFTLATVAAYQPILGVTAPGRSRSRGSGCRSWRSGARQKAATNAAKRISWTFAPQMLPSIGSQIRTSGTASHGMASRRQTRSATARAMPVHT